MKVRLKCANCQSRLIAKRKLKEYEAQCPRCSSAVTVPAGKPPTKKQIDFANSLGIQFDESQLDRSTLSHMIDQRIAATQKLQSQVLDHETEIFKRGYEEGVAACEAELLTNSNFEQIVEQLQQSSDYFILFRMTSEEFDRAEQQFDKLRRGMTVGELNARFKIYRDQITTEQSWLEIIYFLLVSMATDGRFQMPTSE